MMFMVSQPADFHPNFNLKKLRADRKGSKMNKDGKTGKSSVKNMIDELMKRWKL